MLFKRPPSSVNVRYLKLEPWITEEVTCQVGAMIESIVFLSRYRSICSCALCQSAAANTICGTCKHRQSGKTKRRKGKAGCFGEFGLISFRLYADKRVTEEPQGAKNVK